MIGNPAIFKAEHSEAEPKLVFLKPITAQPGESNAMITTKSGRSLVLHLVSSGNAANARVDFLVAYHRPKTLLIEPSTDQSFIIAETRSMRPEESNGILPRHEIPDLVAQELEKQKSLPAPGVKGKRISRMRLREVGAPLLQHLAKKYYEKASKGQRINLNQPKWFLCF
jgi:hypothetical protein